MLCIFLWALILLSPTHFDRLWSHFHLVHNIFTFLLILPLGATYYLDMCCSIAKYLGLPAIFLLPITSLIPLWPKNTLCVISIPFKLLRCISWPRTWSILLNIPWELRRRYILLLLDRVFYKWQLDQVDW